VAGHFRLRNCCIDFLPIRLVDEWDIEPASLCGRLGACD